MWAKSTPATSRRGRAYLPDFSHNFAWGTKINYDNFFQIGFQPKKCHFFILLARPATDQVLCQKFEKVTKTNQNVPKTVIDIWEKSNFLGSFGSQKGAKNATFV